MTLMHRKKPPTIYKVQSREKIDDNVWIVHGTARVRKVFLINRNMSVLRHNKKQLTLINPIRLAPPDEERLLKLGTIVRIIRLAPTHGVSHDTYYLKKFSEIRRWAPYSCMETLPVHRLLTEQDTAILPACHVFVFQGMTEEPECALILLQDYVGNLLVTSEAFQAHRDNPYVNMAVRTIVAAQGMTETDICIPPGWLRRARLQMKACGGTEKKQMLRSEFERLLRLDFERLIGGSGVLIHQGAKEKAVLAVEDGFPQWE